MLREHVRSMGFERFDYLVALVLFGTEGNFHEPGWKREVLRTSNTYNTPLIEECSKIEKDFIRLVFENKHLRNERFSIAVCGKLACVACLPHHAFLNN